MQIGGHLFPSFLPKISHLSIPFQSHRHNLHLSYFQYEAVTNSAAVNVLACVFGEYMYAFPWDKIRRSGLPGL